MMKPIRLISRNENLKLSIRAIFISLPAISSLLVIVLFIICIFGIVALNVLKQTSFYCDTSNIPLSPPDQENLLKTLSDC